MDPVDSQLDDLKRASAALHRSQTCDSLAISLQKPSQIYSKEVHSSTDLTTDTSIFNKQSLDMPLFRSPKRKNENGSGLSVGKLVNSSSSSIVNNVIDFPSIKIEQAEYKRGTPSMEIFNANDVALLERPPQIRAGGHGGKPRSKTDSATQNAFRGEDLAYSAMTPLASPTLSVTSNSDINLNKTKSRAGSVNPLEVYASQKRNKVFHSLFKTIPEDDKLHVEYICALSRDILLQGHLFMSDHHICFNSNILGWVTNLVLPYEDITNIEKKRTAKMFPNAITVETTEAKHIFTSFVSRDPAFSFMNTLWVEKSGKAKRNLSLESVSSQDDQFSESGDDSDSDSDSDSDDSGSDISDIAPISDNGITPGKITRDIKSSPLKAGNIPLSTQPMASNMTIPEPATHAPTNANVQLDSSVNEREICDEIIEAPLGVVFNLLFSDDINFIQTLNEDLKNRDLSTIPNFADVDGKPQRQYSYVKPLNGPIGPKQTTCNITESIEKNDFNDFCYVLSSTTTPDVPSGNAFIVKSKFYLSWAENNKTRFIITCYVEWTGKSWIKGAIEKGSFDGQNEYSKQLVSALNKSVKGESKSTEVDTHKVRKHKKGSKAKKVRSSHPEKSSSNEKSKVETFYQPTMDNVNELLDMIPLSKSIAVPILAIVAFLLLYILVILPFSFIISRITGSHKVNIENTNSSGIHNSYGHSKFGNGDSFRMNAGIGAGFDPRFLMNSNYMILIPMNNNNQEFNGWLKDQYQNNNGKEKAADSAVNNKKSSLLEGDVDDVLNDYSNQELDQFIKETQERLSALKEKASLRDII